MKKILAIFFLAQFLLVGCKDFLEEENRKALTDVLIFDKPAAFDQLVANVYSKARVATSNYDLDHVGTDIFTRGALVLGVDELNDYVNVTPFNWAFQANWANWYFLIAAANTAIDRSSEINGLTADAMNKGIGEAKFFRAFGYYNLVEQYGAVPLILQEIRTSDVSYNKATEEEVYAAIMADLDDALAKVDDNPAQFGRISKSAVRHLKAKVLLTRGYKSFGSPQNFTDAITLAEAVIEKHPLATNIANLFSKAGQRDKEVIFSLLYGNNAVSRSFGNNRHHLFKFTYDVYPGMMRSTNLHRGLGPAPTPFFFTLYEDGDKREDATIRRAFIAEANAGTIKIGDTAIYFPKTVWSNPVIATKNYKVINPGDYFSPNGITQVQYPMFRKFDDPGVPYTNPNTDPWGERDAVIMRSGEAYLLAAEAALAASNKSKAADMVNALRRRAGLTKLYTANEITLDIILDESAKELAGEVSRWLDLKRTGKLIERTLLHNPHAALNKALKPHHLKRPIPNSEIDISEGKLIQNDNY